MDNETFKPYSRTFNVSSIGDCSNTWKTETSEQVALRDLIKRVEELERQNKDLWSAITDLSIAIVNLKEKEK